MKTFKKLVSEMKLNKDHLYVMWNSGASDEEMIKNHGKDAVDKLKHRYGEKSIPVYQLYDLNHKHNLEKNYDDRQKEHHGITGKGALLKYLIKNNR